jgi:hypothetical protein
MKTRIFTTAAMMILTINLIAGTTKWNGKDSTAVLAYAPSAKYSFELKAGNNELTTGAIYTKAADVLENWITARESWEQESEMTKAELIETVNLEAWIASRESWEQQGTDDEINRISEQSDILETWISERMNWEQK